MFHKRGQRHVVFEAADVPDLVVEEAVPEPPPPPKAKAKLQPAMIKKAPKSPAEPLEDWGDSLFGAVTGDKAAKQLYEAKQDALAKSKEQKLQELAALVMVEAGEAVNETPNHLAAMLMVQQLDSLSGSPWIVVDTAGEHDLLAQLVYALQNPVLDLHGPGFLINLDKYGHRLRFAKASPQVAQQFPLEDRTAYFGEGAKRYGKYSIVDLTYWNVESLWGPHSVRALTIPVCRFSNFRGPPILGTKVKSVRRALASFSPFCPCHTNFHITSRGDDGRTVNGLDLVKEYGGDGLSDSQYAAYALAGPTPPKPSLEEPTVWHWDGKVVDPFP